MQWVGIKENPVEGRTSEERRHVLPKPAQEMQTITADRVAAVAETFGDHIRVKLDDVVGDDVA